MPERTLIRRGSAAFLRRLYATPLYGLSLAGAAPQRLARLPPSSKPGDAVRGQEIVAGEIVCASQAFASRDPDWLSPSASTDSLSVLHSFTWLADLAALGTPEAKERARQLVASWLEATSRWHPIAWEPAVSGTRIRRCLLHARFLSTGDDDPLSRPLLRSLSRQKRHLSRTAAAAHPGFDRLVAATALLYADLCGLGDRVGARPLRMLAGEIEQQVLADGGHVERSPGIHVRVLDLLLDARDMLTSAAQPVPTWLTQAIGRMAPMLRFFQHGDTRLASFNNTESEAPEFLDSVLARSGSTEPAPHHAPQSGFARLSAEGTLVIVDTGPPAPNPFDQNAHAGTLAFEMSFGPDRVIVNCGKRASTPDTWRRAERASAAHSTVVVGDFNSSEILPEGGIGRRPRELEFALDINDSNLWLTASHDGYRENLGLVVRRRLFLARDGRDLRGEDTLTGSYAGSYAIRFHLHPNVRASLLQSTAAILLQTPSGSAWRMQAAPAQLSLGESVYFGGPEAQRRTEQIILEGTADNSGQTIIKWAFRRID